MVHIHTRDELEILYSRFFQAALYGNPFSRENFTIRADHIASYINRMRKTRQHTMEFTKEIVLDASQIWFDTFPAMSEEYKRGVVKHIVKQTQHLSVEQLIQMLRGKGLSFPLGSPYETVLARAVELGFVKRDKHNHYSLATAHSKGDKVRALNPKRKAFMQEIYSIVGIIRLNGAVWYALKNSVGRMLSPRKAYQLKAIS